MQKDTRALIKILELKRTLDTDWSDDLEKVNIWSSEMKYMHSFIRFEREQERSMANAILAFIVLAYDASSEFIEPMKDRIENKRSIMKRIAGADALTKEMYIEAVLGDDGGPIDMAINWYIENQKDWRWGEIIDGMETHSKGLLLNRSASTPGEMKEMAPVRLAGEASRLKSDKYLEEIRQEYNDLDTALEKENKPKLTDRLSNDYLSYELHVMKKTNRALRAAAEADSEKD